MGQYVNIKTRERKRRLLANQTSIGRRGGPRTQSWEKQKSKEVLKEGSLYLNFKYKRALQNVSERKAWDVKKEQRGG